MSLRAKKIIGCTLLATLFVDLLGEQALFGLASSFGILGAMGYVLSCIFVSVCLITNTSLRAFMDGFASLFSNDRRITIGDVLPVLVWIVIGTAVLSFLGGFISEIINH